jgi:hypothetical protein
LSGLVASATLAQAAAPPVAEKPGRAVVVSPLDELHHSSAAERWQRLKADPADAGGHPPTPGDARRPRQSLPVAAMAADLPASQSVAPSVADAAVEPAWLVQSRPLTSEEADLTTESAAPNTAAVWRASAPRVGTLRSTTESFADDGDGVISTAAISPGMILPLLPASDPRRQLRAINEISPFYDLTIDKEIRDYADKQAAEYGVQFGAEAYAARAFPDAVFPWEASNLYHYPLYFEDPALERYGHTRGFFVQPFCSAGRFTAQLLALPYQMAIDPICEEMYTLGWYRPGDCAPKLKYKVPWNTHAAVVEAGVVTGLIFLIP